MVRYVELATLFVLRVSKSSLHNSMLSPYGCLKEEKGSGLSSRHGGKLPLEGFK